MNPIPEKQMKKYEQILNNYSSSEYSQLEDRKLLALIDIAGRNGHKKALSEIMEMAVLESRKRIYTQAAVALDGVVHEPTMEMSAEEHANEDLGEIYLRINYAGRTGNKEALAELKKAGMMLGHIGVVESASEKLGVPVTHRDYAETLKGAIKEGRGTLDEISTSLGKCYAALFGNNYLNLSFIVNNDPSVQVSYQQLPREEKDKVNSQILSNINFSALEQAIAAYEADKEPKE